MKHRIGLVIALVLLCCSLALRSALQTAPVTILHDVPYVAAGDPSQTIDLYLPDAAGAKPLPLVIWIHGGGWDGGSKSRCLALGLLEYGYAVASLEYRFSSAAKFPAQIQDCQAAIRWLRANRARYNIDADHIGVWGESAGGHLSALLACLGGKRILPAVGGNEDQSDRVQAAFDWYGPTDFTTLMPQAAAGTTRCIVKFNQGDCFSNLIGVPLSETEEKCRTVSPVYYVSSQSAPMLIIHGTADPAVPFAQGEELANVLKRAGVEVTFQPVPGSGHGGVEFNAPPLQRLARRFFDKHLKGAADAD